MLACLAAPGKPVNSASHHHRNHETRVRNVTRSQRKRSSMLASALRQIRVPSGSRSVTSRSHGSLTTRRLVAPTDHTYSRTPIIALYVWACLALHWTLYAEAREDVGRRHLQRHVGTVLACERESNVEFKRSV